MKILTPLFNLPAPQLLQQPLLDGPPFRPVDPLLRDAVHDLGPHAAIPRRQAMEADIQAEPGQALRLHRLQ